MRKISLGRQAATMAMALAAGMSAGGPASPAPGATGEGTRIQAPSNARQTMAPQTNQSQRAGQSQALGTSRLDFVGPSGSIFSYPAWNQRKARRDARRTNRKVRR